MMMTNMTLWLQGVEAKRGPAPGSRGSRPDGWDGPLSASRVCVLLSNVAFNERRVFTKHQYFDSNGLFISIVVSVPMLANCMAILVSGFTVCS